MLPTNMCTDLPSVLIQCYNHFDLVLLLFSFTLFTFTLFCCSRKGMRSLTHLLCLHHSLTLNDKRNQLSIDCRTINSPMTFCDPTHETTLISHARSPRTCWFESTLLQHLLSWCYFHGFLLRRIFKKRPREKLIFCYFYESLFRGNVAFVLSSIVH